MSKVITSFVSSNKYQMGRVRSSFSEGTSSSLVFIHQIKYHVGLTHP
jgi:hypothetical protein